MHRLITCLVLFSLLSHAGAAETIQVLGIGNSFTVDAFTHLKTISEASETHDLKLSKATIGGSSLYKHARLIKEHEADASTGLGYLRLVDGSKKRCSLKELLTSRRWDVVTIQQVSRKSVDYDSYRPHADVIVASIRQHAPQAKVAIHQTWAYRADGDFARVWPERQGYDQEAMYRDSAAAYQRVAEELDLQLIPVGAAFQVARERKPFVKDTVDLETLEKGELPQDENSLNVGWYWNKKAGKLGHDSHHAGRRGDLLAGLVWYAFLTGEDPRPLELTINGIEADDMAFLKQVAYDVVIEGVRPAIQP